MRSSGSARTVRPFTGHLGFKVNGVDPTRTWGAREADDVRREVTGCEDCDRCPAVWRSDGAVRGPFMLLTPSTPPMRARVAALERVEGRGSFDVRQLAHHHHHHRRDRNNEDRNHEADG